MPNNPIFTSLKELKNEIQGYLNDNRLQEVQKTIKSLYGNAQKDLNSLLKQDIPTIKKKLLNEKKHVQKTVDNLINTEIAKARQFVKKQKMEIDRLQKKVDQLVKESKNKIVKSAGGAKKKKKKVAKKKAAGKKSVNRKVSAKKPSTTAKKVNTKGNV